LLLNIKWMKKKELMMRIRRIKEWERKFDEEQKKR
jgi:hypothetical protein